ncbi:transcriptional regulator FeaR [Sedimentitalea sp. CY04]|uniref:Transcriptional regulator FeaR n=1 Tax=Parasedimentitalea denitrificans TaxID=2211118 RepID=A0ABX0W3I9_9RHOB|nr:transcriptional regulator FeaR [Sedimentitalea sp. CY04]NIZ60204.1 transcriptional regulator FeaR [Sedimentitalea sp. CY04]
MDRPVFSDGRARLESWRKQIQLICGGFETKSQDNVSDFMGCISLEKLSSLEFASIRTNAHSLRKLPKHIKSEDPSDFFLIYQNSGRSVLSQQDKQALLNPGDFALIDSRYQSEFTYLEATQHYSFHIPCDILEPRLKFGSARVCETLSSQSPVGKVLAGFLHQMSPSHRLFGDHESQAMEEAMVTLLAPMADDSERTGGNIGDFSRVATFIDQHLKNEMAPEDIAVAVGMSVRSLYRLFEGRKGTLGTYIREQRLQKCARQLRAPQHQHENITSIAFRWGFGDAAHFSRAFKVKYGMSPRAYRQQN